MNRTGEARGPIAIDPVEPIPIERKGPAAGSRLRIAQVAGPFEPVPPRGYGGTERVIDALVRELIDRGHEVTTYAAGDSEVPGRLVATVPEALRPAGFDEDGSGYLLETAMRVLDDADTVRCARRVGAREVPRRRRRGDPRAELGDRLM